jgi:hypothetical protein
MQHQQRPDVFELELHFRIEPSRISDSAGSVTVTPITQANNPGFQFTAPWEASTSSGVLSMDSTIEFNVSSVNLMNDISISIAGVGFTGTGSITLDETACLGGLLPTCSGGTRGEFVGFLQQHRVQPSQHI